MKKAVLLFLLVFLFSGVSAQTRTNYKIKAQYMHGTILKHTENLENLVLGPTTGGELAVEFQTMGEKAWHQFLNFPEIGAGLVFMDFSNPTMLGQGIALYPYMNVPLIQTDFFRLNLKPGAGVSFLNKRYSNTTNGANRAIGSIMNVFLTLAEIWKCRLQADLVLQPIMLGITFLTEASFSRIRA